MFTRKPRLQLEKFAINGAKRLLQHNLPTAVFAAVRGTGVTECQAHHSGLMPADLITLRHFSISSAMNVASSADVNGIG